MHAITIPQPYASLVVVGAKRFLTLDWKTDYRGPVALHAGNHELPFFDDIDIRKALCRAFEDSSPISSIYGYMNELLRGEVIATAELLECRRITGVSGPLGDRRAIVLENSVGDWISEDEFLLGNWVPGLYAWEFSNVKRLPRPAPAAGAAGLWVWSFDA